MCYSAIKHTLVEEKNGGAELRRQPRRKRMEMSVVWKLHCQKDGACEE